MIRNLLLFLVLGAAFLSVPQAAQSQGETPADLVKAVNALRAELGLDPYQVDPWLMAYAQQHAEYMASIHTGTHIHQDGSLSWDLGIHENVASGDLGYVTVAVAVYEIWVDWGHRHIMVDYPSGQIGAGVAYDAVNNQMYYALNIRPTPGVATLTPQASTPLPFVPYLTSTPDETGWIFHLVASGDTLWSIAVSYGVTVADIRLLNPLLGESNTIYIGQKLLIRTLAAPQAVTQTVTLQPSTTTPVQIEIVASQTIPALPSLSSNPSPTQAPEKDQSSPLPLSLFLVLGIGFAGVVWIAWLGFRRAQRSQ